MRPRLDVSFVSRRSRMPGYHSPCVGPLRQSLSSNHTVVWGSGGCGCQARPAGVLSGLRGGLQSSSGEARRCFSRLWYGLRAVAPDADALLGKSTSRDCSIAELVCDVSSSPLYLVRAGAPRGLALSIVGALGQQQQPRSRALGQLKSSSSRTSNGASPTATIRHQVLRLLTFENPAPGRTARRPPPLTFPSAATRAIRRPCSNSPIPHFPPCMHCSSGNLAREL
jgi:hypothetical protein